MSACGVVAAHVDRFGAPSTWAEAAWLERMRSEDIETPRVDDDSPELQDAVEGDNT